MRFLLVILALTQPVYLLGDSLQAAEEASVEGFWDGFWREDKGRERKATLLVGSPNEQLRRKGTLTFATDDGRTVTVQVTMLYDESRNSLRIDGPVTDTDEIDAVNGVLKTVWNPQTGSINCSGRLQLLFKGAGRRISRQFVFYGPNIHQ